MNGQTLRLKLMPTARRPAAAWFVRSDSVADWLATAAACPGDQELIRVLPVADGETPLHATAALLVAPQFADQPVPPHCQGYIYIAERFLIPVEAEIFPPVSPDELRELTDHADAWHAWHPADGLIRIDRGEALTMNDLLEPPPERAVDWSLARLGPAFVDRLHSVASAEPVRSLDDVENEWQTEIGPTRSHKDLPRDPGEPPLRISERLAQATAKFRRGFAGWMQRIQRKLAANSSHGPARREPAAPGLLQRWLAQFQQWRNSNRPARSLLQRADEDLRRREITRLLKMLESNPDDGLRYAIPFGGELGRGQAPAGNELLASDLNFLLSGGGGRPVDHWSIDPQQQMQLLQRYRELAEREMKAGRTRRAAYIYAQLLADWHSAANALKTGRCFTEAAAVFRDRLKNFSEAARCYEQAGQHEAALRLYHEQEMWVEAGDLCSRLERDDEARDFYREAVQRALTAGDVRRAAGLLETKLQAVDEALKMLEETWPRHPQADQLFDAWFLLSGRHALHDGARRRIESLAEDAALAESLRLLPRLSNVGETYPQADVQRVATERTWTLVGRHLEHANEADTRQLTQFLPSLSPQDRLLPRDCQRFVEQRRRAPAKKRTAPAVAAHALRLEIEQKFALDDLAEPVLSCEQGWVLLDEPVGRPRQGFRLISWDLQAMELPVKRASQSQPHSLAAVEHQRREIWLHHESGDLLLFPWESKQWKLLYPSFLPQNWLAVETTANGTRYVLWVEQHGLVWLSVFLADGSLASAHRVAEEAMASPVDLVSLARGRARIHVVSPEDVLIFLPVDEHHLLGEGFGPDGVRTWSTVLPGRTVVGPVASHGLQMLILDETIVSLVENPRQPQAGHRVYNDWSQPKAAALAGDCFVIADDCRIVVFHAEDGRQFLEHERRASHVRAVAAAGLGRFSILREDGTIEVWRW